MENQTKLSKTINIMQVIIALMGIIMLFFPILTYSYTSRYSTYTYSDSGFSLLNFRGEAVDDYALILGAFSWIQLIVGIVFSIIAVVKLVKGRNVSYGGYIPVWISSILYLLEGLVAMGVSLSYGTETAFTLTWLPFGIITALSIIVTIKLKRNKECLDTNVSTPQVVQQPANTKYQASQKPAPQPETDNSLFTVDGEVKKLKLYDNYLTIETKVNVRAVLTNNLFGGTKKIFYKNILSVQFKESTTFILGYIQFETANSYARDNFNSENSVTFSHTKVPNEYAKQVADFVESKIMEGATPNVVQQTTSNADELLKFKNLLDLGVISQEDFDKKKNELLK